MDERALELRLNRALKGFWSTRSQQAESQGTKTGIKDAGARAAVTGGKHLDGFVQMCRDLVVAAGVEQASVHWRAKREVPGYFRAEKSWDLLVMSGNSLLALIEFKAQVGPSFGNNVNNRSEEALGNAIDFWTAYREGAFPLSPRPWLGFVFILEDCPGSRRPIRASESHFPVRPEFREASYADRYEQLLTKLVRERLYDGACLLLTERPASPRSSIRHTSPQAALSFPKFAAALTAQISGSR